MNGFFLFALLGMVLFFLLGIVLRLKQRKKEAQDRYVCTICGEHHCDCRKQ